MFIKTSLSITSFSLSLISYFCLWLFDSGITTTIHAPEYVKPGETITIEVNIKKGNIGGFAKLQIETSPEQNCIIEEQDSKAASFSTTSNSAKWIWTALPIQQEFKVTFKLKVPPSASGKINLSGKFSYIENNTKQVSEIPPISIIIGDKKESITQQNPTPTTQDTIPPITPTKTSALTSNTTFPTDSLSNTTPTTNSTPSTTEDINISRNIQAISANSWLIKISIQKNNLKGFARYTDVLPKGLTAKAEDKDGSSFFIDNDNIKFVWSSLPDKTTLNITYKLTGNISNPITLNGDFSYTENNQVLNKTLPPETIQPPTPLTTEKNQNNTSPPPTNQTTINNNIAETSIQARQTDVFFSVQLGAYQKSNIGTSYFAKKYNITQVKEEKHETYKKFYTGDFNEYKQARDKREEIKLKGIPDAFVIAHKNNSRITVQEALMITNQKWYP